MKFPMKMIPIFLVCAISLFVSGCGGVFKGKKAAEQGVADFHSLYNDGKVPDIYSGAHAKFKTATTKKQFLELMDAVRRKLGKVKQSSNVGFNIRTFNFTTFVVLTENTTFEQGSGTEVFSFQMDGGKACLIGYNINSNDLIVK